MLLSAVNLRNFIFYKTKVKVEALLKLLNTFILFRYAVVKDKAMHITTIFC